MATAAPTKRDSETTNRSNVAATMKLLLAIIPESFDTLYTWSRTCAGTVTSIDAAARDHGPGHILMKQDLNQELVAMLQKEGCTCRTIRWYSWRRMAAVQLNLLGLPLSRGWAFKRGGLLPAPKWPSKTKTP